MQPFRPKVSRSKQVPGLVRMIKKVLYPVYASGLVPSYEEIRKNARDLPERVLLDSYVRNSTEQEPRYDKEYIRYTPRQGSVALDNARSRTNVVRPSLYCE